MILRPVSKVKSTKISATSTRKVAASADVLSKLVLGRHAITIINNGENVIYVGGSDVTTTNGMPLAVGETATIPVDSDAVDAIYVVGGAAYILEYF